MGTHAKAVAFSSAVEIDSFHTSSANQSALPVWLVGSGTHPSSRFRQQGRNRGEPTERWGKLGFVVEACRAREWSNFSTTWLATKCCGLTLSQILAPCLSHVERGAWSRVISCRHIVHNSMRGML